MVATSGAAHTTGSHTLSQLKAINDSTTGTITLSSYSVDLSGSASDLSAALTGTFAAQYTGNITITGSNPSISELTTINSGTTGNITLPSDSVTFAGSASDLSSALSNNGTITNTLTGAITIDDTELLQQQFYQQLEIQQMER